MIRSRIPGAPRSDTGAHAPVSFGSNRASERYVLCNVLPICRCYLVYLRKLFIGDQPLRGPHTVGDELVSFGTGEIDRDATQNDDVAHSEPHLTICLAVASAPLSTATGCTGLSAGFGDRVP